MEKWSAVGSSITQEHGARHAEDGPNLFIFKHEIVYIAEDSKKSSE